MRRLLLELTRDERGQDLLEYALLTATIGVASIATWPFITTAIGSSYQNLDANTQNLWIPPDPAGGGS